jgi:hypothetical protein
MDMVTTYAERTARAHGAHFSCKPLMVNSYLKHILNLTLTA